MDLKLKPQPKDRGIGSLRTPLHIKGTFGKPDIGPDMGKLAARGGGAIALGILNPLLAILPLIEEGKGKDSTCGQLIAAGFQAKQAQAATASKPRLLPQANPRLLLQPNRLHQARQLRVLLRHQSAELLGRQERRPHARRSRLALTNSGELDRASYRAFQSGNHLTRRSSRHGDAAPRVERDVEPELARRGNLRPRRDRGSA